ncbi:MAG: hypothetical protein Q8S73_36280 [Deltaproteobacteria bacterium]|nr:hypothetical protein [Myxococcales bacterium]MDP3219617.1 hypothetical protein [Deltaproteobacteria bacterium]
MLDGVFRQNTIPRRAAAGTGGARRVRQRVIVLGDYTPRYCLRPPAIAEVMPWDDGPEITEVDDPTPLPPLDG